MDEPIKNLIEIQGGYTSYVDLGLELFNDTSNVERMARYRPIASHRQAFERLAQALKVKDERCYLLTGAYGTGKSHLCLMFANYLQTPSGEKPMPEFLGHYLEVDPHAAEELRSKRTKGRYLVALCQWGGKGDFEEIILRAVDDALHREGFGEDFDTHYLQAIKKIDEWEVLEKDGDGRGRFMEEFRAALENLSPRQTIPAFKKRLKDFDFAALEDFRRIHKNITTADFTYDKSDLVDILTETLASEKFKERYLGLLVLFDEFGDTMERGNLSPKMFQKFAQLAAETPSNCARLIFVGTAHKALTDYAKAYNSIDFRTASDRIKEVELTPNGVEDIISAILKINKEHPEWQKVQARASVFDGLLSDCKRLNLFSWLKSPQIRQNIIENIYPMHPMATYALLQLARDIASNNRSVFTFFAGDLGGESAPGSYGDFIATQPVETGSKLSLYTADRLFDYFSSALSADNRELRETLRDLVKDYESSLRELNRLAAENVNIKLLQNDPLVQRLLRLMLIYEIIQVPNRAENLAFGLYATTQGEKGELTSRLNTLTASGVLYLVKDSGVYEFRKSKSVNLDHLVEQYKKDPEHLPSDVVAQLNNLVPLTKDENFLDAKNYNLTYGEDKRLRRSLVRPTDLETNAYFDALDANLDKVGDVQGHAIYVVCQTADEIQRARNLCAQNKSGRVVAAIPKNPVPLLDAVMEVLALRYIEGSEEAKNFSTQDNSALNTRLHGDSTHKGALAALKELRDKLINHRELTWYGKGANPLPVDASNTFDPANILADKLFGEKRNKFIHDDFNRILLTVDKNKNVALKEAVEELIDFTEPIMVDTSFAQARGDIRYLQKCLLNNNVLKQVKSDGSKLRCEFERDVHKFAHRLPALADMMLEIENLAEGQKLYLSNFLDRYRRAPYGQGSISLVLALACIRRYFGDSVVFKQDDTAIVTMKIHDFETVVSIVQDRRYPQAYLSYRPLHEEEKKLAGEVFKIFDTGDGTAAQTITLQDAYNALYSWWDALPPLSRIAKLYPSEKFPYAVEFLATMEMMASKDPHSFLLDELPKVFGDGEGLAITQKTVDKLAKELPRLKVALAGALQQVEEHVVAAAREMFGVQQLAYSGLVEGISAWFNALDSNQRDPYASWQDNNSKPLVVYLKSISDVPETFMERIPGSPDYGLKRVQDWVTDHTQEYIERLRQGKALIEENRLKVEPPEVETIGRVQRDDGQVLFQDQVTVVMRPKQPGDHIFIAEGSADPTKAESKRDEHKGEVRFEVKDRKTVRYAVRDTDGNWSLVQTLELINETKKFEVAIQHGYKKDDSTATFTFPKDSDGLAVSLRSLIRIAQQLKVANPEQIKKIIQSLLEEL